MEVLLSLSPLLAVLFAGMIVILLRAIWLELRWLNRREEVKVGLERGVNFFLETKK